jgi:hypothetical protein
VLGAEQDTRVVVSVETRPAKEGRGAETTFYDDGAEHLERTLAQVAAALRERPSFAGVAIQDYRGFADLAVANRSADQGATAGPAP